MDTLWSDVLLTDQPQPTISYRTQWVVYEEALIRGQFVGLGWNGAGFINFYDGRLNPIDHPAPQAFWLEIDGQLLASDWEWVGFEKFQANPGKPAELHTIVTLRHILRPVSVKIHTQMAPRSSPAGWK